MQTQSSLALDRAQAALRTMLVNAGKALINKQLNGFSISTNPESDNMGATATSVSCVLTSDGKTGIVPLYYIHYDYRALPQEVKAEALNTYVGPKALQSLKTQQTPELVKGLIAFEKQHANRRYLDSYDKRSERFSAMMQVVKIALLNMQPWVVGELHLREPETHEPDDRIACLELFLKDGQDVDEQGV